MEARRAHWIACGVALVTSGCVPDVEEADTLIERPRVLAIRSEPAELAPRGAATLSALYVDPDGVLSEGPFDWAFCNARKPLAELGPVNPLCLQERGDDLEEIGEGLEVEGELPSSACRFFGPDRPPPTDGEPAGRPVDPDPTGGYYQPLRIFDRDEDSAVLYEARITCGLPGASQAATVAFNQRFAPNENPVIDALVVDDDDELAVAGESEPTRVAPGEQLALELRWEQCEPLPSCDEDCEPAPACDGAEAYVYYDPLTRSISARREGMRVSWFSTGGAFRDARTGRSEREADASDSPNVWTAPDQEGDLVLWTVLRDDRGGVTWQTYAVRVER